MQSDSIPSDTESNSKELLRPRGKPSEDGRFIWISSLAAERIVNEFGATQAAFAIAVYIALARISSREKNNPVVTASVSKLAGMARLSYRKTFDILHALEAARLISIKGGERKPGDIQKAPSSYMLLACRLHNRKPAKLHDMQPRSCTRRTSSRAENPKDSPVRERVKEKEEGAECGGNAAQPPFSPSSFKVEKGDPDINTWRESP